MEILGIRPAVYISIETDKNCAAVVARSWPEVKAFSKEVAEVTEEEISTMASYCTTSAILAYTKMGQQKWNQDAFAFEGQYVFKQPCVEREA